MGRRPKLAVTIHLYSMQVMRPIYDTNGRPPEDLTARARIRDAALMQLAAHGYGGTTIRGVAGAAGVSPGLVQHHFGSKDGLRKACDDAVVDLILTKMAAIDAGKLTNPRFLSFMYTASPPLLRYMARAFVDHSPAAADLLDKMVTLTGEFLTTTWPERFPSGSPRLHDAAVVFVTQGIGTLVLHEHVARQLGLETWKDILSPRISLAQLDVYEAMGEYLSGGFVDELRDAVAASQEQVGGSEKERSDG
ncbi:MAG: TetR family transcriptional regulator [Chloroflexi bacterium]|nr:TetR family transcriptional regulator [Chloroflexota bacterium]